MNALITKLDASKYKDAIEDTRDFLNIQASVVEKDLYTTSVINIIAPIENEYFQLVFAGGTCLSKAHKVIKRMSEDIDFKVERKATTNNFGHDALETKLREFRRHEILATLKNAGITITDKQIVTSNHGKYMRTTIDYQSMYSGAKGLRPHVLVEFTLSNPKLDTSRLPIKSLIEEYYKIAVFEDFEANCISVIETAAEKWVSLTRRVAAMERGLMSNDSTIIRHLYDLHTIFTTQKCDDTFCSLIKEVIKQDVLQFGKTQKDYASDPLLEAEKALTALSTKNSYKEDFKNFAALMVFDDKLPQFKQLIDTLNKITANIQKMLPLT